MSDNAQVKYGMPLRIANIDMKRPEEMQAKRLRELGYTIYPPGSAVPALVEAAKRYAAAPSLRAKRLMAHQLHVAASKVAGEGER